MGATGESYPEFPRQGLHNAQWTLVKPKSLWNTIPHFKVC